MNGLQPVLELNAVTKRFARTARSRARGVVAVDEVDLVVAPHTTVGLVGESGSGKSTLARLAAGVLDVTSGTIRIDGHDRSAGGRRLRRRADVQMVFQDPYSSFDPLAPLGNSIAEPLIVHTKLRGSALDRRVVELLEMVGLGAAHRHRYPREVSGGQLQRAAIARALAVEPKLLILDEPVSSLDVSTQAQVINLLEDLQRQTGTAYLFIAHDLSVVRHISHRIAVMYLGRIVEEGDADSVYESPSHPYTAALLSAIPIPDPVRQRARQRINLTGEIPSPLDPPSGCHFHPRCPHVMDICRVEAPRQSTAAAGARVFCHLVDSSSPAPACGIDPPGHSEKEDDMPMVLKPGTRLFGAASNTEAIVVRAGAEPVDVTIGGSPALLHAGERDPAQTVAAGHDTGTVIGKRYVSQDGTVELLCTKSGAGAIAIGGELLATKDAKPLPASD